MGEPIADIFQRKLLIFGKESRKACWWVLAASTECSQEHRIEYTKDPIAIQ
jgi:hypothetical protein